MEYHPTQLQETNLRMFSGHELLTAERRSSVFSVCDRPERVPELWNENQFIYGVETEGKAVLAKFTHQYWPEVHKKFAEGGHAPKPGG
jgi:hypothetical protein